MKKIIVFTLFPLLSLCQLISYELIQTWSIDDVQDVYNFSSVPSYAGDVNYQVEGSETKITISEASSLKNCDPGPAIVGFDSA